MAVHVRITEGLPALRRVLEAKIEALIALLDYSDGDCDLEDDDPAGEPLDKGELEEWRGLLLPAYGSDQSRGPINERQMHRAYRGAVQQTNGGLS